jgi:predicted transcriptional regulator
LIISSEQKDIKTMDPKSSEFLACFNTIEQHLKHAADAAEHLDFVQLLHQSNLLGIVSSVQNKELKRFARLRNLIAHEHSDQAPLAVPTDHTLQQIRTLARLISNPPKLENLAHKHVDCGRPEDPLGECIRLMHDKDYSQLPIYDDRVFQGLLTADTIARWLGSAFTADGQGIVEDQSVRDVLKHQSSADNVGFISRGAAVGEALRHFDESQQKGHRLDALLMTNSGQPNQALLGIVTIYDIPRLLQAIQG